MSEHPAQPSPVALCGHWNHRPPCPLAPAGPGPVRKDELGHAERLAAEGDAVQQRGGGPLMP